MALLFEFCFYVGVVLTLVGVFMTLKTLFKAQFRDLLKPTVTLLLGVALVFGPAFVSRMMFVDLGPREVMVNNERHLTLTGWDGESYAFLSGKPDTVVLQMANSDVTDSTLELLSGMQNLRELDLNGAAVTDAGLKVLAQHSKLQTLKLRGSNITDDGFRIHLLPMESLQRLELRETAVSAESVADWKAADESRRAFH